MALTLTPIITPRQYHELPSATQTDYENRIVVKQNTSDGIVFTYHVEQDTLFPVLWEALAEKINGDFNIDVDTTTRTENFDLIPNCCDNLNKMELIPYLEQNHLFGIMRIESKPAWWVVSKTSGYFYLEITPVVEAAATAVPASAPAPARVPPPPPNICSVCHVPSYARICNYNCEHHLCCQCFENWDNTAGQRNASQCPECRAPYI